MTRVHVYCEGQTEETFVRDVLFPHFQPSGIYLTAIIHHTSPQGRGGGSTYGKMKREIERLCKSDRTAWVTPFYDLYRIPKDFPGLSDCIKLSLPERVQKMKANFAEDINQRNFIANLTVHEFEGLLFSAPEAFRANGCPDEVIEKLTAIRNQFPSPEHINDGPETAPSKRILSLYRRYEKINDGAAIARDIGLDAIRRECPFFHAWLRRLEALTPAAR